jgi:hypothetical protein
MITQVADEKEGRQGRSIGSPLVPPHVSTGRDTSKSVRLSSTIERSNREPP